MGRRITGTLLAVVLLSGAGYAQTRTGGTITPAKDVAGPTTPVEFRFEVGNGTPNRTTLVVTKGPGDQIVFDAANLTMTYSPGGFVVMLRDGSFTTATNTKPTAFSFMRLFYRGGRFVRMAAD